MLPHLLDLLEHLLQIARGIEKVQGILVVVPEDDLVPKGDLHVLQNDAQQPFLLGYRCLLEQVGENLLFLLVREGLRQLVQLAIDILKAEG